MQSTMLYVRQKDRLLKIEEEDEVCGDKSFNNTSGLYPNGNHQVCPKHLVGKQFDVAECKDDEDVKSIRWSSEGVFSRVIDDAYVDDIIPHSHFPYIHHVVNYSQGQANLYAPYHPPNPDLHPLNASYFADFEKNKAENYKRKAEAREKRAMHKKTKLEESKTENEPAEVD